MGLWLQGRLKTRGFGSWFLHIDLLLSFHFRTTIRNKRILLYSAVISPIYFSKCKRIFTYLLKVIVVIWVVKIRTTADGISKKIKGIRPFTQLEIISHTITSDYSMLEFQWPCHLKFEYALQQWIWFTSRARLKIKDLFIATLNENTPSPTKDETLNRITN